MAQKISDIENVLRSVLEDLFEATKEKRSYSFQGAVSEIAWEVEHNTKNITEDVC